MGPKTKELVTILNECSVMLRSCSEDHWASWFEHSADLLKRGDFSGVEHFESAFGGAGSAYDLVLHPENGHSISVSQASSYNKKLQNFLYSALSLASEIRKNVTFD